MRIARFFISVLACCLMMQAVVAGAGEVRVFKPKEEDISPMELRKQAMAEGFAQAVLEVATPMLPGALGEVRTELLREYFLDHAKPFVLGYDIKSSQDMAAGLILRMDVKVNKKTLREGLKGMGLFVTTQAFLPATVSFDNLDEEQAAQLQGLVSLTGIQVTDDVLPSFILTQGAEKIYKARLVLEDREWIAGGKDMPNVWFELWTKYFSRSEAKASQVASQLLSISGWFSPDGVLEFDRVLRHWDSAIQEVRLVEMDMQPAGVGASWDVRILNADRLNMMLQAYLPQRGLSYQLSEKGE